MAYRWIVIDSEDVTAAPYGTNDEELAKDINANSELHWAIDTQAEMKDAADHPHQDWYEEEEEDEEDDND